MSQSAAHALIAAVLCLPFEVAAQVRSPGVMGMPPRSVALTFGSQPQSPSSNPFLHQAIFLGGPIWYPDYYQPPPVPPPQVVVVQVPPAAMEGKGEARGVHPLLIEWQDDRFVRVTSAEQSPSKHRRERQHYGTEFNLGSNSPASVRELRPALLIFRDGHREESTNYTIVDGVLYSYPDYWTVGAWAKRILICDLDLPATFQQNQQRGVKFILPAGPNQVVTRP